MVIQHLKSALLHHRIRGLLETGDNITFTNAGVYEFVISSANPVGGMSGTITVNVMETPSILAHDFNQSENPDGISPLLKGNAAVNFDGEAMSIIVPTSTDSAFVDMPFGHTLTGIVAFETRFQSNIDSVLMHFSSIIMMPPQMISLSVLPKQYHILS